MYIFFKCKPKTTKIKLSLVLLEIEGLEYKNFNMNLLVYYDLYAIFGYYVDG